MADLRKLEAKYPNDLWQSDVMHGPRVDFDGKRKKTYLIAIIDDHSRLIPKDRFWFSEKLAFSLDTFEKALLRRGLPRKPYIDNGGAFRSRHLEYAAASLGIALFPKVLSSVRSILCLDFRKVTSHKIQSEFFPSVTQNNGTENWYGLPSFNNSLHARFFHSRSNQILTSGLDDWAKRQKNRDLIHVETEGSATSGMIFADLRSARNPSWQNPAEEVVGVARNVEKKMFEEFFILRMISMS